MRNLYPEHYKEIIDKYLDKNPLNEWEKDKDIDLISNFTSNGSGLYICIKCPNHKGCSKNSRRRHMKSLIHIRSNCKK